MSTENKEFSRRDFLKVTSLAAGGAIYLKNKDLFDGLNPEKSLHFENKSIGWPELEMDKLPTEISSIIQSTPEMRIDNGYLSINNNGTWNQIQTTPTEFNMEYSRQIDRLRTGVPWGIVLHWVGGEYDNLERYLEGGFNSLRSYNGGIRYKTSAHFLIGDQDPLTTEFGLDQPVSIAQTQKPDVDGVPFRAAHLAPVNWEGYINNNRRWYPVNAMYELKYACYPEFHSVLQDIYDGLQISVDKRTLGIEIAGEGFDETPPAEQTTANVLATVWTLMKTYNIPAWDVIGHYEIQPGKPDPGKEYISTIRLLLGVKALQESDPQMKQLVFGNFLEGTNYNQAAKEYFESVRKYLLLTSRPDVVSHWESTSKYWLIHDALFNESNDVPVIESLSNPSERSDTILSYEFLDTRRGNGCHIGHDYFPKRSEATPSYLIGDAKCIFAGNLGRNFGNTAVFRIRTSEGSDYIIRYLHLDNLQVTEGEIYSKDYVVGDIGNTGGMNSRRLHFDIAPISTYERVSENELELTYWPSAGTSMYRIQEQFIDPQELIDQYPEPSDSQDNQ